MKEGNKCIYSHIWVKVGTLSHDFTITFKYGINNSRETKGKDQRTPSLSSLTRLIHKMSQMTWHSAAFGFHTEPSELESCHSRLLLSHSNWTIRCNDISIRCQTWQFTCQLSCFCHWHDRKKKISETLWCAAGTGFIYICSFLGVSSGDMNISFTSLTIEIHSTLADDTAKSIIQIKQ